MEISSSEQVKPQRAEQNYSSLAQQAARLAELLKSYRTQSGTGLVELCERSSVLLVFLRHSGCPFCRETLSDLAASLPALNAAQVRPVLVHMGSQERLVRLLQRYGLTGLDYITDRSRRLYRAFGLGKTSPLGLFSIRLIWRGFQAAVLEGHGAGAPDGSVLQLPGAFLLNDCLIVQRVRRREMSGRIDYSSLAAALREPASQGG